MNLVISRIYIYLFLTSSNTSIKGKQLMKLKKKKQQQLIIIGFVWFVNGQAVEKHSLDIRVPPSTQKALLL